MKQRAYRRKLNATRGPDLIKRFRMLRWLQRGMKKANHNGVFGKLGASRRFYIDSDSETVLAIQDFDAYKAEAQRRFREQFVQPMMKEFLKLHITQALIDTK